MGAYQPSGNVGVGIWVVTPFTLALAAGTGAAYQAGLLANPFGIANPVATIVAAVGFGAIVIFSMRAARLRNQGVGALIGVLAAAAFLGAGYWVIADQFAGAPAGALTQRRTDGATLFGGPASATGFWIWLAWIFEAILIGLAGLIPGAIESGRPFCESCGTWARRPRWKFSMGDPGPGAISAMKDVKSIHPLIGHRPGHGSPRRLEYALGSCRCGRMATLTVDLKTPAAKKGEPASSSPVTADVVLTRREAERLFAWAESVDPLMAGKHPTLALTTAPKAREPFALAPRPEGAEFGSTWRWSGAIGATDSGCDNEYTKALRARLKTGDYESAEEALRAQRSADDLAFVAEACAEWEGRPLWMEDWADAKPESAAMLLVRGINGVKWGWQARGTGFKPRNYGLFQRRLADAEPDLFAATERAGRDPTAWAWLLYASKGLGHPREIAEERLAEVVKRSAHHRFAHSVMLQFLCGKWYGSDDQMLAFARRASAAAPAGAHIHVLIAEAHVERSGSVWREKGKRAGTAYWADPAVRTELVRANDRCFNSGGLKATMDTPRTRSYFAYALWKAGERDAAAAHLRIIGRTTPWGPWTPPVFVFGDTVARARRQCGA